MPIKDQNVPTEKFMSKIIAIINQALASGNNIYVHCWGGIGRTGTVVGSYLKSKGLTGTEALDQIKSWWKTVEKSKDYPHSPHTPAQFKFVKKFAPVPRLSSCRTYAQASPVFAPDTEPVEGPGFADLICPSVLGSL